MTNPLHNHSNAQLADEYGDFDAKAKHYQALADVIKAELKARNIDKAEGVKFIVTVSSSDRVTYDDKAIREILGEETVLPFKRTATTTTLRVKPVVVFAGLEDEA
jgi:hypothetical protein